MNQKTKKDMAFEIYLKRMPTMNISLAGKAHASAIQDAIDMAELFLKVYAEHEEKKNA